MAKGKTVPAPAEVTQEEFVKAYNELCQKYGYQIAVTPIWKARDDGTFSLVIQFSVQKLGQ